MPGTDILIPVYYIKTLYNELIILGLICHCFLLKNYFLSSDGPNLSLVGDKFEAKS